MSLYSSIKSAVVLPNGRCSNCNVPVRKTDNEDECYWFYPVSGIKKHKKNNKEYIKCPNCKVFLAE